MSRTIYVFTLIALYCVALPGQCTITIPSDGSDGAFNPTTSVEIDLGPTTQRQAGWREGVHDGARWICGVQVT